MKPSLTNILIGFVIIGIGVLGGGGGWFYLYKNKQRWWGLLVAIAGVVLFIIGLLAILEGKDRCNRNDDCTDKKCMTKDKKPGYPLKVLAGDYKCDESSGGGESTGYCYFDSSNINPATHQPREGWGGQKQCTIDLSKLKGKCGTTMDTKSSKHGAATIACNLHDETTCNEDTGNKCKYTSIFDQVASNCKSNTKDADCTGCCTWDHDEKAPYCCSKGNCMIKEYKSKIDQKTRVAKQRLSCTKPDEDSDQCPSGTEKITDEVCIHGNLIDGEFAWQSDGVWTKPLRAKCSSLSSCGPGLVPDESKDNKYCLGSTCTAEDASTCCKPGPARPGSGPA